MYLPRLTETNLQDKESLVRLVDALVCSPATPFMILQRDGTICEINPAAAARLSTSPENLRGKNMFHVLPAAEISQFRNMFDECTASGRFVSREHTILGRQYSTRVTPVLETDGAVQRVIIFSEDVTDVRTVQDELEKRDALLTDILDKQAEFVCRYKPDGTLTYVNSAYCGFMGLSPDRLLGKAIHPSTPVNSPCWMSANSECRGAESPSAAIELQVVAPDGQNRWQQWTHTAIYSKAGKIAGYQAVGRDITEAKRIQDTVELHDKQLSLILNNTHLVFWIRNLETGKFEYVNSAFERLFGRPVTTLYENPISWVDLVHEGDRSQAIETWFSPRTADKVSDAMLRMYTRDDQISWIHASSLAIVEVEGVTKGVGFCQDVSEHRGRERRHLEQLERYEQRQSRYLTLFNNLPDAILSVDGELREVEANAAFYALCPDAQDKTGSDLRSFLEKFSCPLYDLLKETVSAGIAVHDRRMECRHLSQGINVVTVTCIPFSDKNGVVEGAVLIARDGTTLPVAETKQRVSHEYMGMVGTSESMQQVFSLLKELTSVDTTVLITGESGTGKELVAEALHRSGERAGGPLIKVNCSALSENLLESELFGHVRGAFTGAVRDYPGRFQAAEGGVIFLDEIGDISLSTQLKLLRFLESQEYEHVGDTVTYQANVRVIAATNAELQQKVTDNLFREDLYYRLKVVEVCLPPLRERHKDIPILVTHFIKHFSTDFGKSIQGITDSAMSTLLHYPWPGNVRELKHALEHACIMCREKEITTTNLPSDIVAKSKGAATDNSPYPAAKSQGHVLAEDIRAALLKTGGNKAKAARLLGISRMTLYRKIRAWEEDGYTFEG